MYKLLILMLFFLISFSTPIQGRFLEQPGDSTFVKSGSQKLFQRKCQKCRVTLLNGEDICGKLLGVSGDSLEIEILRRVNYDPPWHTGSVPYSHSISFGTIASIRCGDPIYDGAIWGFVIGGLPTSLIAYSVVSANKEPGYVYEENDALSAAVITLAIGGTVGALMGLFFDATTGYRVEEIDKDTLGEAWK